MDIAARLNIEGNVALKALDGKRTLVDVSWENADRIPELTLEWELPLVDIQYEWYPNCHFNRSLHVDWYAPERARLASSAPVYSFYNGNGVNRFTMALSDAAVLSENSLGVREEDGMLVCKSVIHIDPAMGGKYSIELYCDTDAVSLAEALRRVSRYWETDCGYSPMQVPDIAKESMYSFWYSFHQATFAEDVEKECERAAALGFKTVIVDDGWQTGDGNRGYAYCGDWEPAEVKIPDMAKHVENVHRLGLKYLLWFAVPFVGKNSKHWNEFKDKIIRFNETSGAGTLDPRYPEVRSFLTGIYVKALKEWKLDGFKLDFIDQFRINPGENTEPAEGMDIPVLETAVRTLMTGIMKALKAINPEIMIEFRQSYIGPVMRTYGNMFRVGDCPADPISNRIGTIDLRLLSGSTAVHSDMLMWNSGDADEACALQILSVIFAVMQFSVRLDVITPSQKRILEYWFGFMNENRDLLIDAPIEVENPENLYPVVRAGKNGRAIIAVYQKEKMVTLNADLNEITLLNANYGTEIPIKAKGVYVFETRDCRGAVVACGQLGIEGISLVSIPPCGSIRMNRV